MTVNRRCARCGHRPTCWALCAICRWEAQNGKSKTPTMPTQPVVSHTRRAMHSGSFGTTKGVYGNTVQGAWRRSFSGAWKRS